MKSQTASFKHTEALELQSTKVFEEEPTGTAECKVFYAEFSIPPKQLMPQGSIDIDDLVAELEQSPENAESIAQGRQWVAETFYANRPSIAMLRLQKGWSQAELAKRIGTSQSYIARIELGRVDPQISTVKKFAKALNVPIEKIIEAISPED